MPDLDDDAIVTAVTILDSEDLTRVVPCFDGKLGLDWNFEVACDTWFSLEAGYEWTYYFNVFDRSQPTSTPPPEVEAVPTTFQASERVLSNFNFDGPYLSLNLKV